MNRHKRFFCGMTCVLIVALAFVAICLAGCAHVPILGDIFGPVTKPARITTTNPAPKLHQLSGDVGGHIEASEKLLQDLKEALSRGYADLQGIMQRVREVLVELDAAKNKRDELEAQIDQGGRDYDALADHDELTGLALDTANDRIAAGATQHEADQTTIGNQSTKIAGLQADLKSQHMTAMYVTIVVLMVIGGAVVYVSKGTSPWGWGGLGGGFFTLILIRIYRDAGEWIDAHIAYILAGGLLAAIVLAYLWWQHHQTNVKAAVEKALYTPAPATNPLGTVKP